MFCPNCGAQMPDDAIFCPSCGYRKGGQERSSQNFSQNRGPGINVGKIVISLAIVAIVGVLLWFTVPNIMALFAAEKIVADDSGRDYYLDKEGNRLFDQWIVFRGNEYHLDKQGYIEKNTWIGDFYVDEKGRKKKNDWIEYSGGYCYLKDDGKYARDEILTIDRNKYGFNAYGMMYAGTFFNEPSDISKTYYADAKGELQTNKFFDIYDVTYYFDADGVIAKSGWKEINGEWYYFADDGALFKSMWIDGKYYLGIDGKMLRNAKAPNGLALDDKGEIIPGQSMIEGTVVILTGGSSTLRTIEGAEVSFYDTQNITQKVGETVTDGLGKYQYYLPKGTYKVEVNAAGYETMDSIETINANENKYTELVSLFPSGQTGNGIASGRLTNALDGQPISGAVLYVRKNWNSFTGDFATNNTFTTDAGGNFTINNLPVGYYTIQATKGNFITGFHNIALLSTNPVVDYNFSINPEMPNDGNVRVVLTWGAIPSDLDSHLIGRKPNNNYFDVYFSNKSYTYNGAFMANLDVDDTSSYGPETITITSDLNGTYVYGVHDFSNRSVSNSNKLSYSNCKVTVYMGSQVVAIFNVPTGITGTFWEVFRINEDRTITPINQIYNYEPTSGVYTRFNLLERTNPKYSPIENVTNAITSNNSGSSSSGSSSSSGGTSLGYAETINETYEWEDGTEVKIKIRQPKINNSSYADVESVNDCLGEAMDELISWCQDFIDGSENCPKNITFNTSTVESSTSSQIKIKMSGTITFKSSGSRNVTFMFVYDIGGDTYSFNQQ